MKRTLANCISLGIGLGAIGVALPAQAAFFQGLGDLPGGTFQSAAFGLSADGSVVTGSSVSAVGRLEAFRWSQATGMVGLGLLPGGTGASTVLSQSRGISADGTTIVGASSSANSTFEAFRWTQATGMVSLGGLPSGNVASSDANGVSADGSVIVGTGFGFAGSTINATEAFRWTQQTGYVGLGVLPGTNTRSSSANGVSADGSVVVGQSAFSPNSSFDGRQAYRWTQGTGMVGLGYLPGASTTNAASVANGVSADGSVVVGQSDSASGRQAFRWTQEGGMIGLGFLPGFSSSSNALGVSADGSIVFGTISSGSANQAFIWDASNGMKSVQQLLVNDFGLDLTGWQLTTMRGISADGLTLIGNGLNPNGQFEAWIANLAPSTPGTTPNNPLLPTPDPSNPNGFTFPGVTVGNGGLGTTTPIFFDPIVSVGYDYSVTGGPLFASVLIPNALPQGDSQFTLELPGFGNYSLLAGTTFNLLGINPLGFSNFRISGIDLAEMLDPTNPTAFVTGLTFTSAGTVTVTQNPIVQNTDNVSVPEPSYLFGLGLFGFGAFFKRQLNQRKLGQKDC